MQSRSQQQLPCLGISLLVLTYATLLQDGSLPAESVPTRAADAWQLACSYADGARASHRELLKLLGCSSKTLLYTASTLSLTHKECLTLICPTAGVFHEVLQASLLGQLSGKQQRLTYGLGFLLPTVLMLWAAELTSNSNYGAALSAVSMVTDLSWSYLSAGQEALHEVASKTPRRRQGKQAKKGKKGRRQAQQQPQDAWQRDQQVQREDAGDSSQQQPGEAAASLAAWLASLEPDAVSDSVVLAEKLLRRILQELQERCSSSGGGGSSATAANSASAAAGGLTGMLQAFVTTVNSVRHLDEVLSMALQHSRQTQAPGCTAACAPLGRRMQGSFSG
jgi:hypothetical protein